MKPFILLAFLFPLFLADCSQQPVAAGSGRSTGSDYASYKSKSKSSSAGEIDDILDGNNGDWDDTELAAIGSDPNAPSSNVDEEGIDDASLPWKLTVTVENIMVVAGMLCDKSAAQAGMEALGTVTEGATGVVDSVTSLFLWGGGEESQDEEGLDLFTGGLVTDLGDFHWCIKVRVNEKTTKVSCDEKREVESAGGPILVDETKEFRLSDGAEVTLDVRIWDDDDTSGDDTLVEETVVFTTPRKSGSSERTIPDPDNVDPNDVSTEPECTASANILLEWEK